MDMNKWQFGYGEYENRLCCSSHGLTSGLTYKVIEFYKRAILFHKKLRKEERRKGRIAFKGFNEAVLRLEIFLNGYYKLGAWVPVHAVFVRNVPHLFSHNRCL
jgi:hypothetical protein